MKRIAIGLAIAGALALGMGATATDDLLQVVRDDVVEQVDLGQLKKRYPAPSENSFDKIGPVSDAIVGWYDSGHNFHPEKMSNNTARALGGAQVNPADRIGKGLRGKAFEQKALGR